MPGFLRYLQDSLTYCQTALCYAAGSRSPYDDDDYDCTGEVKKPGSSTCWVGYFSEKAYEFINFCWGNLNADDDQFSSGVPGKVGEQGQASYIMPGTPAPGPSSFFYQKSGEIPGMPGSSVALGCTHVPTGYDDDSVEKGLKEKWFEDLFNTTRSVAEEWAAKMASKANEPDNSWKWIIGFVAVVLLLCCVVAVVNCYSNRSRSHSTLKSSSTKKYDEANKLLEDYPSDDDTGAPSPTA
jgi:hypothetical protein